MSTSSNVYRGSIFKASRRNSYVSGDDAPPGTLPSQQARTPRCLLTKTSAPPSVPEPGSVAIVSGKSFASVSELVREMSVSGRLIQAGYTPIGYIVIKDGDVSYVNYALVYNRESSKLLVELDVEGYVVTTGKDYFVSKTDEADFVHRLHGADAEACAKSAGCTLAFICGDGLCTLDHTVEKENSHLLTNAYKINKEENTAVLEEYDLTLPLVKMSMIYADAKGVDALVSKVSAGIADAARKRLVERFAGPVQDAASLSEALAKMANTRSLYVGALEQSITQLRQYLGAYDPNKSGDLLNRRKAMKEIQARESTLAKLGTDFQEMAQIQSKIQDLTEQVRRYTDYLETAVATKDNMFVQEEDESIYE